jgi:type IV secretory pathway protease TraF
MDIDKTPDFAKQNYNSEKITLKENEYFVLGDNRELAMDSRYYGPVSADLIEGPVRKLI